MDDHLEQRVSALERAVTEGEGDAAALAEAAVTADRLDETEATLEELEDRVAELEAATQALRGYVGNVRSVNREVEERADLALSRVEELAGRTGTDDGTGGREGAARGRDQDEDSELGGSEPDSSGEHRSHGDRCDRCGRPREAERGAGEPSGWSDSEPGGELAGAGPPDRQNGLSRNGTGAFGPEEGSVRASGGSDADGPIDRLRQLL